MSDALNENLEDVKKLLEKIFAVIKLVNSEKIAEARSNLLKNKNKKQIYDLCDGKHTVTDIVKALGTTQPTVSYHLSSLLEAGLVSYEDVSGNRYYTKTLE